MNRVYELKELQKRLGQQLQRVEASEVEVTTAWLLEHYLNINRIDLLLNREVVVSSTTQQQLKGAVDRLNQKEPIQYVLGEAYFYGRKLKVSSDVLIPRRETEELVAWVKEENPEDKLRTLDVGTGSGCIAITLSLEMNQPDVHALDVSERAINIAISNAALHEADVTFWAGNILYNDLILPTPFDIIVSNPPYVRRSEAHHMASRVLDYEPDVALFVDNQQPLLFYERMIHLGRSEGWLKKGGKIYWEINEAMGDRLLHLLHENQFQEIRLRKDMQGKARFVTGKLAE